MKLSLTLWLVIINIIFFIIALFAGIFSNPNCNVTICKYIALQPIGIFQNFYLWTFLTSMFMHGSFAHLFINMFVLISLGSLMERIIGRKRFVLFYIISGIFAGIIYVFLAYFFGFGLGEKIFGGPDSYAVGASGAIFAIAGLFVILIPKARFTIIFFPFFSLPGYIMIPLVLVLTWVISLLAPIGIGNTAHLGGFLGGLIYGLYLRRKYRRKVKLLNKMFN